MRRTREQTIVYCLHTMILCLLNVSLWYVLVIPVPVTLICMSGVRSFNALYVDTDLLKFILFGTENRPIISVLISACKIMRAACFC